MSYQVLARKWRPRNFQALVGQGHVLRTLVNALDHDRLHHAYLFTGTRGVGKTTIARILARCLNCETGVTSTPCGECSACREINEGRFIDLIEVDAASRTKVEDTRELLENVQYAPTRGRYKVYLIDEVHMLSTHSFNALLKTLEEPPPHVKFLLATTDPQKLPVTVLSRCLQFNLKNLSPERLVEHMKHILGEENIDYEEAALWQLGRAAQGSVRDCLTLLDQAIGFCEGKLTDQGVGEFLGNIDRAIISRLVDALVAQDAAALLRQVNEAAEHSPDFALILQELLSWLHRVAIAQVVPEAIDNAQGDRDQVLAHAAALPAETLQLYYQVALKGREELVHALDARSGLEMTLLRMLAFTPAGIPKPPGRRLSAQGAGALENEKKKPLKPEPEIPVPERPPQPEQPSPYLPDSPPEIQPRPEPGPAPSRPNREPDYQPEAPPDLPPETEPERPNRRPDSPYLPDTPPEQPVQPGPEIQPPPETEAVAASRETDTLPAVSAAPDLPLAELAPEHWTGLFGKLELSGVTRSIAGNTVLGEVDGERLTLQLDEQNATIFNDEHRKRIEQALREYFGAAVQLKVEVTEVRAETPAVYRRRREQEHRNEALRSFREDPLVRTLVQEFNARIHQDSVVPLKAVEL